MPSYNKKDSLNSVGDSWATISISEESGDLSEPSPHKLLQPSDDYDCDDTNLDDTLPVDALDEMDTVDMPQLKTGCDYLWPTPIPPKNIREFRPAFCSSSIHPDSEIAIRKSESFDFQPKFCSSKLENDKGAPLLRRQFSHANPENERFKSPAPIIREIARLRPGLRSNSDLKQSESEEFKPQRCSTALSESELKLNKCLTDMGENSNLFAPLRCSTGINECSNPEKAGLLAEFMPLRTSTGLHENSVAFLPLRCSTGLNESATFNPPMSSTAQYIEDSNIPEFKNLRLLSGSNPVL
ncbi:uncharacterized protein LOC117639998 [Thrips palmi]|uniref:Uncharacterized protein LOC117639998 n=1 Tax=Thrips palmi TaxID=161013 RepID=A0A6P8ZHK8_THRPL|nr:uncharacterized protein LOC117639998 [Thrips palmi]